MLWEGILRMLQFLWKYSTSYKSPKSPSCDQSNYQFLLNNPQTLVGASEQVIGEKGWILSSFFIFSIILRKKKLLFSTTLRKAWRWQKWFRALSCTWETFVKRKTWPKEGSGSMALFQSKVHRYFRRPACWEGGRCWFFISIYLTNEFRLFLKLQQSWFLPVS